MNSARSSLARIGVGTFSAMLGTVLLLMVGGLYFADQALRRSSRDQAVVDAHEAALVVRHTLDAEREALTSFRGAFAAPDAVQPLVLSALASAIGGERPGVERLWVRDEDAGRTVLDTIIGVAPGEQLTVDPAALAARVLQTGAPVVTPAGRDGSGMHVAVAVPLMVRGRLEGVTVAVFRVRELFASVVTDPPQGRAGIVIRRGTDTVLAVGNTDGTTERMAATAEVPFGEAWTVDVAYVRGSNALRLGIWTLGTFGLVALLAGMIRERRQAVRISERSSELERLSAELLRANRMKSEFLANVSHELRTPLNAIVGFVELLRDGVYGELTPRQMPPVERIAASATHLRHLVDQVLDIAKIAAGRLEVHPELVVLRPFVLNVASELESLVNERGLTLSIAVGASLPRVRTDPQHLRQILVNLIGNAVKYTPAGGIAVRTRLVGAPRPAGAPRASPGDDPMLAARSPDAARTWVALQVIDTGIGIDPADQERIFEEFEQVNAGSRTDSMERGTGLGLAISRRLSRLLGGDITVESQVGKGSTFTLWLPVASNEIEHHTPVPSETPAVAGGGVA